MYQVSHDSVIQNTQDNPEHLLRTISELTASNVKHLEDIRTLQTQCDINTRKSLGLQYKLVETTKAKELYQNAISSFLANATCVHNANTLTDCFVRIRDSVTRLFNLTSVDMLFRTLGGTYDDSIPMSEFFNNTDLVQTFLNVKSHVDECQRLNTFSLTQCNCEQMYMLGCPSGYAYSAIYISDVRPMFAFVCERATPLELYELQLLDMLLKAYSVVIRLKGMLMESTIISSAFANRYQRAVEKSLTDSLTHIYNHEALMENIETNLVNTPYLIIFYDLDKFKYINDTFGHHAGDQVLIWFAHMVKDFSNELGGDAYRYGGDEFISIFPGNTDLTHLVENNLENFIRKVRQKEFVFTKILEDSGITEEPTDDMGYRHHITTSIGLYYNAKCLPFAVAKERADTGLYTSKTQGRNTVTIITDDAEETV